MRYTLGQARKRLAGYGNTYGITNLDDAINAAIQALASLSGWECLRKVVRYSSVGPCFTLPQGSAGLVRVCVNGSPSTVRGQDFRFLQSGPGDLRETPVGFSPFEMRNVLDLGESPIAIEPPRPFRLFAFSDADNPSAQPSLTVKGYDESGRVITVQVPMKAPPTYGPDGSVISGDDPGTVESSAAVFRSLIEVSIDDAATGYISLYIEDAAGGDRYPVAMYNTFEKAPMFRRYKLSGIAPGKPVEILAEVRIDPLPLLSASDVLPFDCIEPIEWMINYDWCMKSGEVDKAQKFKSEAANWLKSKEIVKDTVQTSIVINGQMPGSNGEDSFAAMNI